MSSNVQPGNILSALVAAIAIGSLLYVSIFVVLPIVCVCCLLYSIYRSFQNAIQVQYPESVLKNYEQDQKLRQELVRNQVQNQVQEQVRVQVQQPVQQPVNLINKSPTMTTNYERYNYANPNYRYRY